jgi:hypothetical protein
MSADDRAANLSGFFQTAAQNRRNRFRRNKIGWKSHEVQCGNRPTAHRENIGERIGRSDLSVSERVVNDGRKEVHGLNESAMSIQTINAGVIERARIHEDVAIAMSW